MASSNKHVKADAVREVLPRLLQQVLTHKQLQFERRKDRQPMEILETVKRRFKGRKVYVIDRLPVFLELNDTAKAELYGRKEPQSESSGQSDSDG